MKKRNFVILAAVEMMVVSVFYSCSEAIFSDRETVKTTKLAKLESTVTPRVMKAIADSVQAQRKVQSSVGEAFTEDEAREVLLPLVKDGEDIRAQILQNVSAGEYELTPEELQELQELDDLGMIELSLALQYANLYVLKETPEGTVAWDCFKDAFGIRGVRYVWNVIKGTKDVISASTLMGICKGLGLRYLGYVGLAYSAYKWAVCMHDNPYVAPVDSIPIGRENSDLAAFPACGLHGTYGKSHVLVVS